MVQKRSDVKLLTTLQMLVLAAAVNRGDEVATLPGTGERRLVAAVFDEHRDEIVAAARTGSAAAARLVEEFDERSAP